jgi:intron-binding protein aquarius
MILFKKNLIFRFALRRIMLLEFSQYLESYLWEHYTADEVTYKIMYLLLKTKTFFHPKV